MDSSSYTKPMMQGSWSVIALKNIGVATLQEIDTGIAIVTRDLAKGNYTGF